MQYVHEKEVYHKVPRREAEKNHWKVVKTRWIDVNKGDKDNPNHRSRLVAKEFNTGDVGMGDELGADILADLMQSLKLMVNSTPEI